MVLEKWFLRKKVEKQSLKVIYPYGSRFISFLWKFGPRKPLSVLETF